MSPIKTNLFSAEKHSLRYFRRYSRQQGLRRRLLTLLPVPFKSLILLPISYRQVLDMANGRAPTAHRMAPQRSFLPVFTYRASFCLRLPATVLYINTLVANAHFE
jgi:hypothetical protein